MKQPIDEYPVPGLDEAAAQRWRRMPREVSPWLHEEVARRMAERLQWFRDQPSSWLHWEPGLGGLQAHRTLLTQLAGAKAQVWTEDGAPLPSSLASGGRRRWNPLSWGRAADQVGRVTGDAMADMLWANMNLHMEARPQTLLRQWHRHIALGGFLMFSCLGPDSLQELRMVYAREGWPDPAHAFTDMHDWGDMLIQAGFAEPVMDMERLTLTYSSAGAMLDELRGLGRNLASRRYTGLRGRGWRQRLEQAIERHGARSDDGRLVLGFEVIYGHAFKAEPRTMGADGTQTVSVDDMRTMLRRRRT